MKNYLNILILGGVLFSAVAFPCAHNFEGEVYGLGFSYLDKNKASAVRLEMIAGKSLANKQAVKIFLVQSGSSVEILGDEALEEKGPNNSETVQETFEFINKSLRTLGARTGARSGASSSVKIIEENFKAGGAKAFIYPATAEDVLRIESQDVDTSKLFDYLMLKHGFESTHQSFMNYALKKALQANYDVVVTQATLSEEALANSEMNTTFAVKMTTPLQTSETYSLEQAYFEEIVIAKTLDNLISSTGTYLFEIQNSSTDSIEDFLSHANEKTRMNWIVNAKGEYGRDWKSVRDQEGQGSIPYAKFAFGYKLDFGSSIFSPVPLSFDGFKSIRKSESEQSHVLKMTDFLQLESGVYNYRDQRFRMVTSVKASEENPKPSLLYIY